MYKFFFITGLLLALQASAQTKTKAEKIDSFLTGLYRQQQLNGNVLVAEKGQVIYQHSFGKANLATGQDLDAGSVFELASVSKQFTAMGIMILKKQGKLSYEDTLRRFFPMLPYPGITIRHLLQHTSGLPDYMELLSEHGDTTHIYTNADVIGVMAQYKPAVVFQPGEKWEYSNTGYMLLASLIENLSGQDFKTFLEQNIFTPLGMRHTTVYRRRYEKKRVIPNYAYGYVKGKTGQFALPDSLPGVSTMVWCMDGIVGDGTVNATTGDLLLWDRALYTEKLVSKAMLEEAFTPGQLNSGAKHTYGFGWATGEAPGIGRVLNHSGGWPGYNTFIERHPDTDKTIIVLRNYDVPLKGMIGTIRNILYEIKPAAAPEIMLPADSLRQYIGEYELAPDFSIAITAEGTQLFAQATGQERFPLFASAPDQFFLKVVEARLRFNRDVNGNITGLTLYQNGQEVPGKKTK